MGAVSLGLSWLLAQNEPSPAEASAGAVKIEIASVEMPALLEAVIEEAARQRVVVHRVSQGSGIALLADDEITEMLEMAHTAGVEEVCLFLTPRAVWDIGGQAATYSGSSAARGTAGVRGSLRDAKRAADLGCRSLLVGDLGVLALLAEMRAGGDLPPDLRFKTSASLSIANPAMARLCEKLGADSINLGTDLDVQVLADIRRAVEVPLDVYLEAPDDMGGFVRQHEVADIVRAAAPVYLKFGLRGARPTYPFGYQHRSVGVEQVREKVRRARLALDELHRQQGGSL